MKIKVTGICKWCGGDGIDPDHPERICPVCDGLKEITETMEVKKIEVTISPKMGSMFGNGKCSFWQLEK